MSLEINLYAEILIHVRRVTIYGTLRNKNKTNTTAYVTSDQNTVSLVYDGQTTSITLPIGIRIKSSIGFPVAIDSSDLSLRLDLLEDSQIPQGLQLDVESDSPWSAASLNSETLVACKQCQSIIVAKEPREWKDLPRGLWAETLDQWYCHRPEVKGVVQKEYSGSKGPKLQKGTAFVDTCHFVFLPEDCKSIKIEGLNLTCAKCSQTIGIVDNQLEGYRLYKWALQVKRTSSDPWKKHEVQNFICAQMLEFMEDQNVRKFLAFSGKLSEADHGLLLWVFNPEIKYSSSKIDPGRLRCAMKVLFEKVDNPKSIADKLQLAVEDVPLPSGALEQLEKDLDNSHDNLPEPAKKLLPPAAMGNWKVGLLERFNDGPKKAPP